MVFRTIRNASTEAAAGTAAEKTVHPVADVAVRHSQLPLVNLGDRKLPFLNRYEKPKQVLNYTPRAFLGLIHSFFRP